MGGAEGVIDVNLLAAREFVSEVAVVGLFFGMEAQILKQDRRPDCRSLIIRPVVSPMQSGASVTF